MNLSCARGRCNGPVIFPRARPLARGFDTGCSSQTGLESEGPFHAVSNLRLPIRRFSAIVITRASVR